MLNRDGLKPLVVEALRSFDGSARMRDVAKFIWDNYRDELESAGEFLYVWQYDLRWAGDALVKEGKLRKGPPSGTWFLL